MSLRIAPPPSSLLPTFQRSSDPEMTPDKYRRRRRLDAEAAIAMNTEAPPTLAGRAIETAVASLALLASAALACILGRGRRA